ncbi:MAG: hypothetical protein QHH07_11380 [Sedimentisphaerales bacterium]|nr:hypothetical protein [Sedimentisphaerales bacterium]
MRLAKFRLVSGDLSGIQDYIYHTAREQPKGASKRLRARSFYLGLLTELAARMILEELGLLCFNRIINAGVRFTLLVPNTKATMDRLHQIRRQIGRWFFIHFKGLLNLNLDFDLEIAGQDFMSGRFGQIQRQLAWHTEKAKILPFASFLQVDRKWDPSVFLHENTCSDQGEAFLDKLGSQLPRAGSICVARADSTAAAGADHPFARPFDYYTIDVQQGYPAELSNLTCVLELVPPPDGRALERVKYGWLVATYVPRISDQDLQVCNQPKVQRWLASVGREEQDEAQSSQVGGTKTFAHLALDTLQRLPDGTFRGQPLLAVLKADVDRLGFLLGFGFGGRASIGRMVSLSRQLDFFFKAVLPTLLARPPRADPEFRNIYVVYTGGDDLLMVGPWNAVLRFAAFLDDAFKAFVFDAKAMSISAGISFFARNSPVIQAVMEADEALEKAKDAGRNRICVFGQVLRALENGQFLDELICGHVLGIRISKSLIYRFLTYARMAQDTSRWHNLAWRSRMAYDLARNVEVEKDHPQAVKAKERLEQMTVLSADGSSIDKLIVATTYCLYQNRGGLS